MISLTELLVVALKFLSFWQFLLLRRKCSFQLNIILSFMCSKELQRKCINCSVWNFFPSSVEIISFLNTAWKEFQNLQFIHFLHAVSYLMWINSFTTNDRKTWQWWKIIYFIEGRYLSIKYFYMLLFLFGLMYRWNISLKEVLY